MAASVELGDSLEELEELFLEDFTDDFFDLNEEENSSDIPVSAKDNFLCTNVNTSSLKLLLDRLAERGVNRPFYSCVLSYLAMNACEAGVDLALIQTSLLFSCKCNLISIRTT